MNKSIINGFGNDLASGAGTAILSIIMVFAILLVIIVLCELIGKIIEKAEKKYLPVIEEDNNCNNETCALNLDDEDATVACLIASIECRNETHKNVKIVSVREVK